MTLTCESFNNIFKFAPIGDKTSETDMSPNDKLDEKDQEILAEAQYRFDVLSGPRIGDIIRFSDDVEQRVTHVHGFGDAWSGVQTNDAKYRSTFYFDFGTCSYSGGLLPGVPRGTLTLTDERKLAPVWFFHHGVSKAYNGVDAEAVFRVYTCNLESSRAN